MELLNWALELNPDAAECLSRKAQLVSDTTEITALLMHAIAVTPKNPYYRKQLVYNYLQQQKYDSAVAVLSTVVDLDEYPVDDLWMLYGLQEQQLYYDDALHTLERLERLEGENENFAYSRIKIYLNTHRTEEAYDEAKRLCRNYPNDVRYPLILASLYLETGRGDEGYQICREVQTKEPKNELVLIWLLNYYHDRGDTTAYEAIVDSVACYPAISADTRCKVLESYVNEVRDDTTKATVDRVTSLLRQALRQPQDDSSLAELCEKYMDYRHLPADSITKVLYRNLEITPDNSRARTRLLLQFVREGNNEALARLCRDGILYNPTHLHYYLYEGLALSQQGNDAEAIAVLRKGTEQYDGEHQRDLASDIYALLGDLLHTEGKKAEAYAAYDSSLVCNAGNLSCLNNYAYFLSLDNVRLKQAEEMSYKTVKAEANNPVYLDTYAWILYVQKRYEQARLYIDETMKHIDENDENASVIDHAGDIYLKCGEEREAVDFWKRALRLTTDADLRKEIIRKLKKHTDL